MKNIKEIDNVDIRFNSLYRPEKFKDVVGQQSAVKTLRGSIRDNSVQSAYLLIGKSGSGKTTVARIFANSLICKNRTDDYEPCGECQSCKTFKENPSLVDVIEIDAGSKGGIDNIREMNSSLKYSPKENYRIIIIDEAHRLSKEGATALLKTIEEPPENTVFMFATTEPDKILNTIKNRCIKLVFNKLSPELILERLKMIAENNNIKYENEALLSIAMGCDGGLRDAITLLQQVSIMSSGKKIKKGDLKDLIRVEESYIKDVISFILDGNVVKIIDVIDKEGDKISELDFDYFISRFRRYLYETDIDIQTSLLITEIVNVFVEYKNKSTYNIALKTLMELALIESIGILSEQEESLAWLKQKFAIQNKDEFVLLLEKMNKESKKSKKHNISNIKEEEKVHGDINNNKDIVKNKADMFISLMSIKYRDFNHKFKAIDVEIKDDKILYFSVDDIKMKSDLIAFLKREYSQSLKPICEIDGFVVRIKKYVK